MKLQRWKVTFPLPRCCRCGNDALACFVMQTHDKKAVKQNGSAVKRWRARIKSAERMLLGASRVEEK